MIIITMDHKGISELIKKKKSNLVLSADMIKQNDILSLVDQIGPYLLGVKLHSDCIIDLNGVYFINELMKLKKKHNFLIIEDRKFCDIGNTVKLQSDHITQYADLITVHSVSGEGILAGLRENCLKNNCRILLLAQMSSQGCLINKEYTQSTVDMAKKNKDIVAGFICQQYLADGFIHFTPGCKLGSTGDSLGQQYNTPKFLIEEKKVDVLIVGRGIYQADKPVEEAVKYIYVKNKI